MSFDSLLIDTVTIFPWQGEGTTTDRYGSLISDFGAGVDFPARVNEIKAEEFLRDTDIRRITLLTERDTRRTTMKVFLPADADPYVSALTEIEYKGDRYHVLGEPSRLENSIGLHHIQLIMELVVA